MKSTPSIIHSKRKWIYHLISEIDLPDKKKWLSSLLIHTKKAYQEIQTDSLKKAIDEIVAPINNYKITADKNDKNWNVLLIELDKQLQDIAKILDKAGNAQLALYYSVMRILLCGFETYSFFDLAHRLRKQGKTRESRIVQKIGDNKPSQYEK